MRIYNIDGSVKISTKETIFGWWFCDIVVDENVHNFQEKNMRLREIYANLSDRSDSFEETWQLEVSVELLEPKIKLGRIKSTHCTILVDEDRSGYFNPYVNNVTNTDVYTSLINSSLEFMQKQARAVSNTDNTTLSMSHNKILKRYLRNYDKTNNLKAHIDNAKYKDISICKGPRCNHILENKKDKGMGKKFCNKTCDMHFELDMIRKCFEMEEIKVDKLLQESIKLRQEILECNYLDEMIALLMGEPERVKSKHWPFKFAKPSGNNLII